MRTEIIGSNVSSALGWRISYITGRLSLHIKEEKECPSLLPTNSLPPELLGPSNSKFLGENRRVPIEYRRFKNLDSNIS